jgi:8-oxo-dGTP pyrophosphatase MutT (NUDIX family)
MFAEFLPKVTAFVTRQRASGTELLLFRHPNAAIQFPAGTVEENETFEQAVLREVAEETGLTHVRLVGCIGQRDELPPRFTHVILHSTKVHARPDHSSAAWAELRRGIAVSLQRQQNGFAQVTYDEGDRFPDPSYISYQITGWVPEEMLASTNRRKFFHLELVGDAPDSWEQFSDNHLFALFWARLDNLPEIISLQREWLDYAIHYFNDKM